MLRDWKIRLALLGIVLFLALDFKTMYTTYYGGSSVPLQDISRDLRFVTVTNDIEERSVPRDKTTQESTLRQHMTNAVKGLNSKAQHNVQDAEKQITGQTGQVDANKGIYYVTDRRKTTEDQSNPSHMYTNDVDETIARHSGNTTGTGRAFEMDKHTNEQHLNSGNKEKGITRQTQKINSTTNDDERSDQMDDHDRKPGTQPEFETTNRNIGLTRNIKQISIAGDGKERGKLTNEIDTVPESGTQLFTSKKNEGVTAHTSPVGTTVNSDREEHRVKNTNSIVESNSNNTDNVKPRAVETRNTQVIVPGIEAETNKNAKQQNTLAESNDISKLKTNIQNVGYVYGTIKEAHIASSVQNVIKELKELNTTTHSAKQDASMGTIKEFYTEYPVARLQGRRLTAYEKSKHHLEMHAEYENVDYNITLHDQLPSDLKFLQNNETFCQQKNVDILFYIISAPHHIDERQQARETWAKTQTFNHQNYSAVFFIGRTESRSVQQRLSEEFMTYGDVIQLDMVDSYKNLTLKGVGAVKWMTSYCSRVKYVIKADDDLVVDIRHFADVISMQIIPENRHQPKMFCLYAKNGGVHRHKSSKWYVPPDLLPGLLRYPPFCLGSFYGYPGFLLPKMHQASMLTPLFWLEDVYFTGFIVPQLLEDQLRYINIKGVWCDTHGQYFTSLQAHRIYFDVNTKTSGLYWKHITRRYYGVA